MLDAVYHCTPFARTCSFKSARSTSFTEDFLLNVVFFYLSGSPDFGVYHADLICFC